MVGMLVWAGDSRFSSVVMDVSINFGYLFEGAIIVLASNSLFLSGVFVGSIVHVLVINLMVLLTFILTAVLCLGIGFVSIQALEYAALFFCLSSASLPCHFFAITFLHGFHVFLGLLGLSQLFMGLSSYGLFSLVDSCSHGPSLGVYLYWHFVDVVWLVVGALVYGCAVYLV